MGRAHEVRKQSMAKTAAMKSAVYGRSAKEIYLAAKNGSPDPDANLALRSAIEKAKAHQVPSDVINRAIKRAQGNEHENYTSNRYEGYGPGNSMIIVDSLTTNVNRAIAEIRDAFNKNGGKLAQAGAVSHSFNSVSIFSIPNKSVDEILELLMEVEDVNINDVVEEDGDTVIYADFSSFNTIRQKLDGFGIKEFNMAETTVLPSEYTTIDDKEQLEKFEKLINKLNELEDVQNLYHNIKID